MDAEFSQSDDPGKNFLILRIVGSLAHLSRQLHIWKCVLSFYNSEEL